VVIDTEASDTAGRVRRYRAAAEELLPAACGCLGVETG